MIQGTTPKHIFTIPFDTESIDKLSIAYGQNDAVVLKKTEEDCVIEGHKITVKLTQEDTLKLKENVTVKIQLRVLLKSGDALASDIKYKPAREVLDKEVL